MDVKITMTRNSNNLINITLYEENSRAQFFDGTMTLEDFGAAITGLYQVPIKADVRFLDVIGKHKVVENRSVECSLNPYNRKALEQWLSEYKEEGWIVDTYLGSQNSVATKAGKTILHFRVFKYV